jgi:tetratricopeptide (TPR) repeat protein
MNKQDLYNILSNNKVNYSPIELLGLKKLATDYPYFQLAQLVYSKALYVNKDGNFKTQLSFTATNINDREALFSYIYSEYTVTTIEDKSIKPTVEKIQKPIIEKEKEEETEIKKPITQALQNNEGKEVKSKVELMKVVSDRLKEEEERKEEKGEKRKEEGEKREEKVSSIDLVEKFIKLRPEINRPGDKDYNNEIEIANESLEEDYELVSETMALLFEKQGHIKKAIKIYEKLILIYPEKNTYFAARISELNK